MKIGIIGTGSVGTALATGLASAGHEVIVGSRDPEKSGSGDFEIATQRMAAVRSDIVVLALPADVVAGGLDTAEHLENLARFWIHLSQQHGRNIAFRLLREEP